MPQIDAAQLVRAALERNKEIPAVLDAYGEFVDSPIGQLELQSLADVFASILDNLNQRFPDAASRRAAKVAQTDVMSFLSALGNDPDRVRVVMRTELMNYTKIMASSIAERFRRMNSEERQAIDATLRIIKKSKVELLFRAEKGKPLSGNDLDFKRFFALVKSQAPGIRELRYQNLIVEKAIFNKLILKSKGEDYSIWVPSVFVKEAADLLIERNGLKSERVLLSTLKDIETQGDVKSIEPFLSELIEDLGIASQDLPKQVSSFFRKVDDFNVLPPIYLDDVLAYFGGKQAALEEEARKTAERERVAVEAEQKELERRSQLQKQRTQQHEVQIANTSEPRGEREGAVFLGKKLDLNQLIGAIGARIPENQMSSQVRQLGEYFLELGDKTDVSIVGASGSGKSVTLNRLLAGIAAKPTKVLVIDPRGEHRGIAWKYEWPVLAVTKDSQAESLKIGLSTDTEEDQRLLADLIQEWLVQNGTPCSDVHKERIYSILSAKKGEKLNLSLIADLIASEPELSQFGQRLQRNLVQKGTLSRILTEVSSTQNFLEGSMLFDLSGRGLKDPTTKEERSLLVTLLLRQISELGVRNSVIVVEDVLDRYKVESLRSKVIDMFERLRARGNRFIITSRSECRDFLGDERIELIHRLSGEKTIVDEFSGFNTNAPIEILTKMITLLPRGYALTSRFGGRPTEAVAIDRLSFNDA